MPPPDELAVLETIRQLLTSEFVEAHQTLEIEVRLSTRAGVRRVDRGRPGEEMEVGGRRGTEAGVGFETARLLTGCGTERGERGVDGAAPVDDGPGHPEEDEIVVQDGGARRA